MSELWSSCDTDTLTLAQFGHTLVVAYLGKQAENWWESRDSISTHADLSCSVDACPH